MFLSQFINTVQLILRSGSKNKISAINKHLFWQIRKLFNIFPFEQKISNSLMIVKNKNDSVAALVNCLNMYDDNNMNLIKILLNNGGNFIDIGANVGSYSLIASEQEYAKVFSFEPHPKTFSLLMDNVRLNKKSNVKAFNFAISEKEEIISFSNYNKSSLNRIVEKREKNSIMVKSIRMDSFLAENNINPDFVKVDVEGFEYEVLMSFGEYLRNVKIFFIEFNSLKSILRHNQIKALLRSYNFYGPLSFNFGEFEFGFAKENGEDVIFISDSFKDEISEMKFSFKDI